MQKLKKALKKLAGLNSSSKKVAIAAKKAPAVKKKTQAVAAKKAAPAKKPVKNVVKAASKAPAKAAPVKSAGAKDKKSKTAVVKTPPAKVAAKEIKKSASAPAPAAVQGKKVKAIEKSEKAEKPVKKAIEAASVEPSEAEVQPKSAKGKKRDEIVAAEAQAEDEEVVLTDADGRRYCRVKECDQVAAVDTYCRYHYLLFWRNIQNRKKILSEGKLERYVEELTARYPDKYLEMLRKDLRSEKDFTAAIQELEIDESAVDNEFEDEAQGYLDEVRGMGSEPATREEEDF